MSSDLLYRRRKLLGLLVGAAGVTTGAVALVTSRRAPSARIRGVQVQRWGCQYQNIDLPKLAASEMDMLVLDSSLGHRPIAASEIVDLKRKPGGKRRIVLAYLCVGEAESYRPYWRQEWASAPPSWLGRENANWPGSFSVRFWDDAWQDIVFRGERSLLRGILDVGFDGVFLDRVDGYGDWPELGEAPRADMIALIERLSGTAKAQDPHFIVVAQNAEHIMLSPVYLGAIDAVSKESLLYGLKGENIPNDEADVAWSLNHLRRATSTGHPVFAIEYVSEPKRQQLARSRYRELGFVPFFGNRLLDRLPV